MSIQSEKCIHSSALRAEDWSEMAERICAWPLPDDLCADTIACKPGAPYRAGTNLMTVTQALAMLDYACKPIIDAALTAERERADRAEAAKDGAYLERNQCVALIARMAMALGYWAGTAKTAIEGWSEDWHGCVYIDLPAGQVSWHFHDSQAHLFDWLPPYCAEWDGHDTPEKYRRVLNRVLMPNAYGVREQRRAEKAEAERDALQQQVDGLVRGLEAVQALMLESTGVYGLHPNGDGAPWDELRFGGRFEEWLVDFDAAIDAAMRAEG